MTSDGSNNVVCHAVIPGSYSYDIDKPSNQALPQVKPQPHTGVFSMHVGSCTNCNYMKNAPSQKNTTSPDQGGGASSIQEVKISCEAAGNPTTVDPQAGPSGLKVDDYVTFSFQGSYQQTTPMTLTFEPPDCANNPNPGKSFEIRGNSGYCQVATKPTITYSAMSNQCTTSKATLSVSASQ
jgi:hypothetical protein